MKPVYVVLMFCAAMALSFWGGWCAGGKGDAGVTVPALAPTMPVPIVVGPPVVLPAPPPIVVVRRDSTWKRRYDSLLAEIKARPDTALSKLTEPWQQTHQWRAEPDSGWFVAGTVFMAVDVVGRYVTPRMRLDSMIVPALQNPTIIVQPSGVPWLEMSAAFAVGALAVFSVTR